MHNWQKDKWHNLWFNVSVYAHCKDSCCRFPQWLCPLAWSKRRTKRVWSCNGYLAFLMLNRLYLVHTLWLFNSSPWYRWPIEIDGLPIKNGDFPWRTVSHNQRVIYIVFYYGYQRSLPVVHIPKKLTGDWSWLAWAASHNPKKWGDWYNNGSMDQWY